MSLLQDHWLPFVEQKSSSVCHWQPLFCEESSLIEIVQRTVERRSFEEE